MAFGLVDLSGLTVEDLILHRGSGPTDDGCSPLVAQRPKLGAGFGKHDKPLLQDK